MFFAAEILLSPSTPTALSPDVRNLVLWLLERQSPPLHLLRTADVGWWTRLREHRLFPLLYYRLQQAGLLGVLPPEAVQYLKKDYAAALSLLLRQEAETRRTLQTLAAAGFEVILLKGADLRLRLYEDPATRPMIDLDLLVAPESLEAVQALLRNIGYTLSLDSVNPRPGFRERYRVGLHFKAPPPGSLMVDLHWGVEGVAGYYRLPFSRLASQTQTRDWQGLPVRVLSPEHLLLHLCLHNYDEWNEALRLMDLGLALTRLPLNWQLFLWEAAACRCRAPLLLMLRGLEELLPGAVPLQVLQELATYTPLAVERLVLRHSLHPLARLLGPLSHQRRLSAWAAYFAALLWPDPAYIRAVYGSRRRLAYLGSSLKHLFTKSR